MKTMIFAALPVVALVSATSASAQYAPSNEAAPGYSSLLNSNFSNAEREIRTADVSPYDPARAMNLGIALAKTGHRAEAADQFRSVLREDNVEMVVASGRTVMSHDLAYQALAALDNGLLSR